MYWEPGSKKLGDYHLKKNCRPTSEQFATYPCMRVNKQSKIHKWCVDTEKSYMLGAVEDHT